VTGVYEIGESLGLSRGRNAMMTFLKESVDRDASGVHDPGRRACALEL